MKLKKTNLLFIATLLVLMPFFAIQTQAATQYPPDVSSTIYHVDIAQNPPEVYAGEIIIITATIDMVRDEEITAARLSHIFSEDISPQPSIPCEEDLPMLENVATFIFGPFNEGDFIQYKIYLEFQLLVLNFQSEWFSFTVGGTRSVLSNLQIMYICLGSAGAVVIAVALVIILRKRR